MRKFLVSFGVIFSVLTGFSLAASTILNPSYSVNGDDIKIYRTNNSLGGYVDINLQDPKTNDWLHFGEVKISDQVFKYTKQWDGDQKVWMIPGDGGDEIRFTIKGNKTSSAEVNNNSTKTEKSGITRTVIPVVPKTGPSGSLIGIILATLAIFGGYIYIRKKAEI